MDHRYRSLGEGEAVTRVTVLLSSRLHYLNGFSYTFDCQDKYLQQLLLLKSGLLSEPNCNALFSVYKMALDKEKESKEEYCYRIVTKIQSFLSQYADSTIRNFLTQNIFDKIISLSKSYLTNINDDSVFQSLIDELNRLHTPSKAETQEQTLGMMSLTNWS